MHAGNRAGGGQAEGKRQARRLPAACQCPVATPGPNPPPYTTQQADHPNTTAAAVPANKKRKSQEQTKGSKKKQKTEGKPDLGSCISTKPTESQRGERRGSQCKQRGPEYDPG